MHGTQQPFQPILLFESDGRVFSQLGISPTSVYLPTEMAIPPPEIVSHPYVMTPFIPEGFASIQAVSFPPMEGLTIAPQEAQPCLPASIAPQAQNQTNCSRIAPKRKTPPIKFEDHPDGDVLPSLGILDCKWLKCLERFSALDELVNHINDVHIRVEHDAEYKCHWRNCPRRGRGFNARYKMLVHVRTHTNERPHVCKVCGKSFSRLENLKIHIRSHTGEKPYICPVIGCKKAYSNSSDRFKHVRTHETSKPYFCRFRGCHKRYTDPSSLRKHIKSYSHQLIDNNNTENMCVNQFNSPPVPNILPQVVATETVVKLTGQESPLDLTVAASHTTHVLMQ